MHINSFTLKQLSRHIPLGRGGNSIHSLYNPVQSRVSADGHVCTTEVIINGAHEASNVDVAVGVALCWGDLAWEKNIITIFQNSQKEYN